MAQDSSQVEYTLEPIQYTLEPIQLGPEFKDTTPMPQPDLYIDEGGRQRSRSNDTVLDQFNPFMDKFAKGLTDKDAELLKYWYRGEYSGSKPTQEDLKAIDSIREIVEDQVKHLPSNKSRREGGQEYIDFYNWGGLLMDRILKHYDTIKPGKRTEDDKPSAYTKVVQYLENLSKHFSTIPQDLKEVPWQKQALEILNQAISVLPASAGGIRRPRASKGISKEQIQTLQEKFKPLLEAIEEQPKDALGKLKTNFKQPELDLIKALKEEGLGAADIHNYFLPHRDSSTIWKRLSGKASFEESPWPKGREPKYNKEELTKLIKEGKSYQEIADTLGTTRNAIAGTINRMGLGMGRSPNPAGRGAEYQGDTVPSERTKYTPQLARINTPEAALDAELEALLKKNPGASLLDLLPKAVTKLDK